MCVCVCVGGGGGVVIIIVSRHAKGTAIFTRLTYLDKCDYDYCYFSFYFNFSTIM